MRRQIILDGVFRPEQEKTYVDVPFDMPAGAVRLDVSYSYSSPIDSHPLMSGGNTVDLGVFDERGVGFLRAGFRGCSGSVRDAFFITESEATPGYLAGPLLPGRWHVNLGLYKVADGCAYHLTIAITTKRGHVPTGSLRPPVTSLPSSPLPARYSPWLCGELHCHTWHSDGELSPADVVALARRRGLDFLAISDHNTTAAQYELAALHDPGLILIPGVEVTTFNGHFNVWGSGDWVDFRVHNADEMSAALRLAGERGALRSCNHPRPYGPPWAFEDVTDYDCIEVWNGPWFVLNSISLDFWTRRLAQGRRIPAIAGSDWHRVSEMAGDQPRAPGTPCVWLHVPEQPSAAAILSAIRQGHIAMSEDVSGPLLDLRAGVSAEADGRRRCAASCGRPSAGARALPARGRLPVAVARPDGRSLRAPADPGRRDRDRRSACCIQPLCAR